MDVHPTPRVTIDGGRGWQVDEASPDVIGSDPGSGRRWRRPSRALVTAVAASALLGFGAATVLAERRHDPIADSEAATLSVSAWATGGYDDQQNVRIKDGRVRLLVPFELANTGPRDILLLSVRLPGTGVGTDDLAGQRVTPGTRVRLALVRPLECGGQLRQVAAEGEVSRLVVRARTDAGERQVEVRAPLNTGLLTHHIAVAMCGELPPDEALIADMTDGPVVDGKVARLSVQVANGSRYALTVGRVSAVVPWLSTRFVDEHGRAVPLPMSLPAGDFSTPHLPWNESPRSQTWRVEIGVPDCRLVPSSPERDLEEQLLAVDVDSGDRAGTAQFGGDANALARELAKAACPS